MNEAAEIIKHLKSLDKDELAAEKMRKKIISMALVMGCTFTLPSPARVRVREKRI